MDKDITDIIFDLDGTLIDSGKSILESFRGTLELNNIQPILPLNYDLIGPPLSNTLSRLTGINELEVLSKLIEDFKKIYDYEGYKATAPFRGIDKLLFECSESRLTLHIATNKRSVPTELILNYLGWTRYFKTVYAIDSVTPFFSDKSELISAQITNNKINPNSATYIGDRAEDLKAAIDNGLKFYGATWGYKDKRMILDKKINSFDTVEKFIEVIKKRKEYE